MSPQCTAAFFHAPPICPNSPARNAHSVGNEKSKTFFSLLPNRLHTKKKFELILLVILHDSRYLFDLKTFGALRKKNNKKNDLQFSLPTRVEGAPFFRNARGDFGNLNDSFRRVGNEVWNIGEWRMIFRWQRVESSLIHRAMPNFRIARATHWITSTALFYGAESRSHPSTASNEGCYMVSAKFCNGGHVCSPPKECCTLGCCYVYSHSSPPVTEMFTFLIWTYWYLWAAILAGLALAAVCGCWLWHRRRDGSSDDCSSSDRASSGSFYPPPHYSRCSSFIQALPPPYNEVTAKPDLYPLVIGYDEGVGKGTSGFVMRYFRTLSHASTLDSLSSSFMCNVVNEANTIIPPPYSCNNSLDELTTMGRDREETADGGSIVSLANNRTASDISSLAAQSPCSPPRATSPTIELRELLDKIQQLPQVPSENSFATTAHYQNRPQVLQPLIGHSGSQRPVSPGEFGCTRVRRTRGKMYMPLGLPSARNKTKRWLSRSAPTTPSGTIPMSLFPGNSRRPSEAENYGQQFVPLLAEQDEIDINNLAHCGRGSSLTEQEEETQQL